jgi:PDDEXK-like domain of unknown function (DUF3799)
MRDPGFYDGITHADYLADADGPRLSASLAHLMLSKCPRRAWAAHPLLGNLAAEEKSEGRDRGALLHALLLGGGPEITIVDAADWRTNAAKDEKAAVLAAGALPVLAGVYERAEETASCIEVALADEGIDITEMAKERVAFWKEGEVECRARFDLHGPEPWQLWDLKFTRNANPSVFGRQMVAMGYDVQRAAYVSAVEHLMPELAGRVRMKFVLVEAFGSFAVGIANPAGSMRSSGESRWARALKIWASCLARGNERQHWPGYGEQEVEAPPWQLSEELSATIAAAGEEDWVTGREE